MKRILSVLVTFVLLFTFSVPAFAEETDMKQQNTSFEISLEEAIALANPADITIENGVTTIPLS